LNFCGLNSEKMAEITQEDLTYFEQEKNIATRTKITIGDQSDVDFESYSYSFDISFGAATASVNLPNQDGKYSPEKEGCLINLGDSLTITEGVKKKDGTWYDKQKFSGIVTQINPAISGGIPKVTVTALDKIAKLEKWDVDLEKQATPTEVKNKKMKPEEVTGPEEYDNSKSYSEGDIVLFKDMGYKCIKDAPAGVDPSNSDYWESGYGWSQVYSFYDDDWDSGGYRARNIAPLPGPIFKFKSKVLFPYEGLPEGTPEINYETGVVRFAKALNIHDYDVYATFSYYKEGIFVEDAIKTVLQDKVEYGQPFADAEMSSHQDAGDELTTDALDYATIELYTYLNENISETQTGDIKVDRTSGIFLDNQEFESHGFILVGDEVMEYDSKTDTTFHIKADGRGKNGIQVEHLANEVVYQVYPKGQLWYLTYSNLKTDLALSDFTISEGSASATKFSKRFGRLTLNEPYPSAMVTCNKSYEFWTIQATGIQVPYYSFRSRNIDNRLTAINELRKLVAPNYLLRTKGDGLVWGQHISQKLIGCDYELPLKTQINYASDQTLYTRVKLFGENACPENLMLSYPTAKLDNYVFIPSNYRVHTEAPVDLTLTKVDPNARVTTTTGEFRSIHQLQSEAYAEPSGLAFFQPSGITYSEIAQDSEVKLWVTGGSVPFETEVVKVAISGGKGTPDIARILKESEINPKAPDDHNPSFLAIDENVIFTKAEIYSTAGETDKEGTIKPRIYNKRDSVTVNGRTITGIGFFDIEDSKIEFMAGIYLLILEVRTNYLNASIHQDSIVVPLPIFETFLTSSDRMQKNSSEISASGNWSISNPELAQDGNESTAASWARDGTGSVEIDFKRTCIVQEVTLKTLAHYHWNPVSLEYLDSNGLWQNTGWTLSISVTVYSESALYRTYSLESWLSMTDSEKWEIFNTYSPEIKWYHLTFGKKTEELKGSSFVTTTKLRFTGKDQPSGYLYEFSVKGFECNFVASAEFDYWIHEPVGTRNLQALRDGVYDTQVSFVFREKPVKGIQLLTIRMPEEFIKLNQKIQEILILGGYWKPLPIRPEVHFGFKASLSLRKSEDGQNWTSISEKTEGFDLEHAQLVEFKEDDLGRDFTTKYLGLFLEDVEEREFPPEVKYPLAIAEIRIYPDIVISEEATLVDKDTPETDKTVQDVNDLRAKFGDVLLKDKTISKILCTKQLLRRRAKKLLEYYARKEATKCSVETLIPCLADLGQTIGIKDPVNIGSTAKNYFCESVSSTGKRATLTLARY